jgi:hypothetical protein
MQYLLRFIISFRLNFNLELQKMDQISEKKWFFYTNNHHEGPFSAEEIQLKVSQGTLHSDSFLWKDGMPTWKMMKDIEDFSPMNLLHPVEQPVLNTDQAQRPTQMAQDIQSAPTTSGDQEDKTGDIQPEELQQTRMIGRQALLKEAVTPSPPKEPLKTNKSWTLRPQKNVIFKILALLTLSFLLLITLRLGAIDSLLEEPIVRSSLHRLLRLSRPYLIKITEDIPSLGKFVPPLLKLNDVSVIDYEELRAAATTNLQKKGPQFGIAVTQTDPFAPYFYISSNLPDGAQFDLYIIGIPETLLNDVSFEGHLTATLQKQLAKTTPLRKQEGRPLPKGDYEIYLTSSLQQNESIKSIIEAYPSPPVRTPIALPPGTRILSLKKAFLGGQKDAQYQNKLQNFHEKLRARALGELNELKQHTSTLDHQFQALIQNSQILTQRNKPMAKRKKAWDSFQTPWLKIQNQISQLAQSWTLEVISNEYYYGVVYTDVQSTTQMIWN